MKEHVIRRLNPVFCILLVVLPAAVIADAPTQPLSNAIASAHPVATRAGKTILQAGGNAFDAAVAVAAALAVVEPYSSGLGGGGFFLLHRASDGKQIFVDARETAPAAATADMFLDEKGEFVRGRALNTALAAGIPGLPAALVHLAENYGRLTLEQALAPAIALARNGFEIGQRYSRMAGFREKAFATSPEAAGIFLDAGKAPAPGYRVMQPDLAGTLEQIAAVGNAAFYHGELALRLVAGVKAVGGIWELADLAAYEVKERAPIVASYHDINIVSAPPPSSGGIVLAEALNILERFDLDSFGADARMHAIIEAMRRAYRDRAEFLGDPDFFDVPTARLITKAYAAKLAENLDLDRATPSDTLPGIAGDPEGRNTTHYSILDAEGNRVAATLSINYPFGTAAVPAGTGVLLNNEMDDFSARPLTPNAYGLVGAHANAIAPGKRPLSSMTPTFLESPRGIGILGTPGGSRIISMVLIGTLEFARGADPEVWVSAKRFHHQYLPDEVQYERGGLTEPQQTALRKKGHVLREISRNYGNMHAILWHRGSGEVKAASDPRGEGAALVWLPE